MNLIAIGAMPNSIDKKFVENCTLNRHRESTVYDANK